MAGIENPNDSAILEIRSQLDAIKRINKNNGKPFWMARDLQEKLGYETWENFHSAVGRAIDSCITSGVNVDQHIRETTKMMPTGKGAVRGGVDYFLSQHGAHLIAMNGDPQKSEIAVAQMYFSVQTLKQELAEQMTDEDRRIKLRDRVKTNNKKLSATAIDSGVTNRGMPVFHAAGYQGLYGGRNKADILVRKGLDATDDLLDRSGSTELAANDFRITQTQEALSKKGKIGEVAAVSEHNRIGRMVRDTITEIGGTMPEDLAPEPSIKKIESARKKQEKLKAKEPKGLI